MPHYYFHTADGERELDHDGAELAGDAEARVEAIRYGGQILNHQPDVLWDGKDFRVEVTDEKRELLFTIIMIAVDAPRLRDHAGADS